MKITRLTIQKNNNERVNIFIDGSYCLSLTKDQILDYKLFVNKEIGEPELERLKRSSNEGLVKAKTIEWLFIRPRSARELSLYLLKKKIDPELSQKIIDEMQRKKYQNDQQFCEWWVDQRLAKNMSLTKIKSELFSKGINRTVVEQVINNKNINESKNMALFIQSKRLTQKYPDKLKLKKYLFSKGYSYDVINEYFTQQN